MVINYFYAYITEEGNVGYGTFEVTTNGESPNNKELTDEIDKLVEKRLDGKKYCLTALNRL